MARLSEYYNDDTGMDTNGDIRVPDDFVDSIDGEIPEPRVPTPRPPEPVVGGEEYHRIRAFLDSAIEAAKDGQSEHLIIEVEGHRVLLAKWLATDLFKADLTDAEREQIKSDCQKQMADYDEARAPKSEGATPTVRLIEHADETPAQIEWSTKYNYYDGRGYSPDRIIKEIGAYPE